MAGTATQKFGMTIRRPDFHNTMSTDRTRYRKHGLTGESD
jgi:hypothetical protein